MPPILETNAHDEESPVRGNKTTLRKVKMLRADSTPLGYLLSKNYYSRDDV